MAEQILKEAKETTQPSSGAGCHVAQGQNGGSFKGWLTMVICCAAPLLILAAVAFFGISLGAFASGFFTVAALLACPVGMYLMMRMMSKEK